jgi:hypothetical protein
MTLRAGVQVNIQGHSAGSYTIQPYDTWQGIYLDEINVACAESEPCTISLPDFISDMVFKIVRR